MKFTVLATVLAAASAVEAHAHVWSIWVNGQDQGGSSPALFLGRFLLY